MSRTPFIAATLIGLATVLAGGHAITASASGGQDACRALQRQFDEAWPAHQQHPKAARARERWSAGVEECRAGHYAEGTHDLRLALRTLGVLPVDPDSAGSREQRPAT
jgi:hypothetical protein